MEEQTTLTSVKEIIDHLDVLKNWSNLSVASLLEAQIQVLKFSQCSELVNSAFDLVFYNADKALNSSTEEDKEQIREQIQLMCHSFLFFTKAKLMYEEACLFKESKELITQKYSILSGSVSGILKGIAELSKLSKYGGEGVPMPKVDIDKLLDEFMKKEGVIERFFNWFSRKKIHKMKQDDLRIRKKEFSRMLQLFVYKLYNNKKIIGTSLLISGIIENYQDVLIKEFADELSADISQKKASCTEAANNIFGVILGLAIGGVFLVCLVVLLLLLAHGVVYVFFSSSILWTYLVNLISFWIYAVYYILGLGVAAFATLLFFYSKYRIIKQQANRKIKQHLIKMNTIYRDFHPCSENLYDVNTELKNIIG